MEIIIDRQPKVIAVTGGKGGVGKSNIAINLAVAMSKLQSQVLLLDADMGLSNIDVLLDLHATKNLQDLLDGDYTLNEILVDGPCGIKVIPGSSGSCRLANISSIEMQCLRQHFSTLNLQPNNLIIDTSAGIGNSVLELSSSSDEILVVVCNEPASIADAYALIKVLNTKYHVKKFRIIANKIASQGESDDLFAKLTNVVDKFLIANIGLLGWIPEDKHFERAVRKRKSVVDYYPNSRASICFFDIAKKLLNIPKKHEYSGRTEFFEQHLMMR